MVAIAPPLDVPALLRRQQDYFQTGATRSLAFRRQQLEKLAAALESRSEAFLAALQADLRKPRLEAYASEIGFVLTEIQHTLKHLDRWMRPQRVGISLLQFPGGAFRQPEPRGLALIIGPWNYPVQLLLAPLVGAIAAGCCAVLKPSELTPNTSAQLAELIRQTFPEEYVCLVEGAVETSQALLAEPFDHIFFTGGTAIGRIVMTAAAQHLSSVTLELGGKSPCIIAPDADLDVTARRIVWGKFLNAGQTCIAPDYLLAHESIKEPLIERMIGCLSDFYGSDPQQSPDLARIVSDRHFERLTRFLQDGRIRWGGQQDAGQRYIAPTLIDEVDWTSAIMQDEIFGPLLPILSYRDLEGAIAQIVAQPKPLALYLFSRDGETQRRILSETSSGGVCLNDTLMQVGVPELPFGGVGPSGLGAYHGKASFEAFSHYKSVLKRPFWGDVALRYPPYDGNKLSLFRRILG
jgi:aldehyde dehydrogenase (NAD+)